MKSGRRVWVLSQEGGDYEDHYTNTHGVFTDADLAKAWAVKWTQEVAKEHWSNRVYLKMGPWKIEEDGAWVCAVDRGYCEWIITPYEVQDEGGDEVS